MYDFLLVALYGDRVFGYAFGDILFHCGVNSDFFGKFTRLAENFDHFAKVLVKLHSRHNRNAAAELFIFIGSSAQSVESIVPVAVQRP